GVALDARLNLELRILNLAHYLLGELLLDPDAKRGDLLQLAAAHLFDVAEFKHAYVDAPAGKLGRKNVGHLLQLEIVVGVERELLLLLLDARIRALEIEAGRYFLVGLVEGVAELDLVY